MARRDRRPSWGGRGGRCGGWGLRWAVVAGWGAAGRFAGWASLRAVARQSLRSLCCLLRPMLLGAGLCGAVRARAAAGAASTAGPGRAVAGGVS
jgi:hypothetical protein